MEETQGTELCQTQVNALIALYSAGRFQDVLQQGIALAEQHPNVSAIPDLLGAVYMGLGRKEDAVASFRRSLELEPENGTTCNKLGIALSSLGRHKEAADHFRKALEIKPGSAAIYSNLGNALVSLGNHQAAVASFERALAIKPDYVDVHYNLGNTYNSLGRHEEAILSYRRALALKPDYTEAHNNLGNSLNSLGRHEEAAAVFQNALEITPDCSAMHINHGNALIKLGRHYDAAASYRKALALEPDYAEAHYHLGVALDKLGRHEEAVVSYQRATHLDKGYILARGRLIHQLALTCDWDEIGNTIQTDLRSLQFGRHPKAVLSPFDLFSFIDDPGFQRRVAEAYAFANFKSNPSLGPFLNNTGTDRIRIGYFSADFHNHATMYLMAELFERHDRSKFEIHAFSFGPDTQDEMRSRLLTSVEAFHDVRLTNNAEIAALSRSLGIDIAVDLKGYTQDGRTRIFSYRAAPIQVNYLGYPGTMGAPYIDYIIADPALIPPAYREYYSEKVAYLPGSYQVNKSDCEISEKAISRADFELPDEGFVFCSFNNNYKIMPDVFDIWMRLLGETEGSVLWLLKANETAERNLRKEAVKRGISPDRLIFAERVSSRDHLARHRLADLFLDTFNCNAHTTASDALRAGLPVLTKMGESFPSRVAGSLLTAVGLPELITTTARDYEDIALMLARHPGKLHELKAKLRHNLKTTSLFDTAAFARHIESAFTQMHRRQKEGLEPDHIFVAK